MPAALRAVASRMIGWWATIRRARSRRPALRVADIAAARACVDCGAPVPAGRVRCGDCIADLNHRPAPRRYAQRGSGSASMALLSRAENVIDLRDHYRCIVCQHRTASVYAEVCACDCHYHRPAMAGAR
jgi:hypothetical protein